MSKKGQSSIELMALVGAAIFLVLLFSVVMVYYLRISSQQELAFSAQDLALTLKAEIDIASTVEDKYERIIDLPATVDEKSYGLYIGAEGSGKTSKRELLIELEGNQFSEILATDITGIGVGSAEGQSKQFLKISKGINNPGEITLQLVAN